MENKNEPKSAIITYNSTFLNCDSIFIEYDDVIKCPFFLFLNSIKDNEALSSIFDLSEISGLGMEELYEWYTNRKHQNIFKCLKLRDGVIEQFFENSIDLFNTWCEEVIYLSIDTNDYHVPSDTELNFVKVLSALMSQSLVDKYYIYTPYKSNKIEEDLIKLFGTGVTYVYGKLEDVLKENGITPNSTFVFSDLNKVHVLDKVGLLNLSSVIIADKYGYNYKDKTTPNLDVESLSKNSIFKLDFFNNIDLT